MPRRTKEQAQATRDQLLDAAESLFLAHGLVHTSLNDIAQAAGLTRGAIYWHFADKVALAQALLDRVDLPMEQALSEAEQAVQADPIDRLHTLALAPFALMQRDPRARRVFAIMLQRTEFVGELAPLTERHNAALGSCIMRMERLFQAAQRRKRLAPGVRPGPAATALLALVDGLLRLATQSAVLPASGSTPVASSPGTPAAARQPAKGNPDACSVWSDCAAMRAAGPAISALLAGLSQRAPAAKSLSAGLSETLPQTVGEPDRPPQKGRLASRPKRAARAPKQ